MPSREEAQLSPCSSWHLDHYKISSRTCGSQGETSYASSHHHRHIRSPLVDYGDDGCEDGRGVVDTLSPGPGAQLRVISTSVRACLGPYESVVRLGARSGFAGRIAWGSSFLHLWLWRIETRGYVGVLWLMCLVRPRPFENFDHWAQAVSCHEAITFSTLNTVRIRCPTKEKLYNDSR